MQEKVVFKLDVYDERIRQKAMTLVSEFSGVTSIDLKEQGKLKVTGAFDKFVMTKKLKKIYEYADIIGVEPDGEPVQNRNQVKVPKPKVNKPIRQTKVTKPTTTYPRRKPGQAKNSDACIIL
ncbi:hypothetical protein EUTSA_v10015036mg [Eutrema salsugineum]|uniref:HMA domain-containing protein n=1 Tax=Eutrema salsugineum TaxID=72664 RepID=V4KZ32_EUTSA|nr:heavy metal-associated isoprenylated plant protein 10 [Eutrema salsugineum]ESQ43245.1 hypothetical protein EUTSA_v10015036mg [Eutrema salsugineum]